MWNHLVASHHNSQKMIALQAVAELAPLWGILDFHDLPGTTADWLRAVRPAIERHLLMSQYVAAEFVKNYRSVRFPHVAPLEVEFPHPLGVFGEPMVPDRDTQIRIMVSQKVTGPVWVAKNTSPGVDELQIQDLMARGFSKSTGAAIRVILNGGRGTVRMMADLDDLAVGVAGVADETSCDSCKFVTKPILKVDGARKMDAVAIGHDFCTCTARLVY